MRSYPRLANVYGHTFIALVVIAIVLVAVFAVPSLVVKPLPAFAATNIGETPLLELPWPSGQKHNINGGYTYGCGDHTGRDAYAIDFALPSGSQVSAVAQGTAHTVSGKTGYGNYIWISNPNNFVSLYAHLKSFAIKDGQSVRRGQLIGYSGSTGNSTGPHLHFTLRSNATTQFNGNAAKPEPMSGYVDFGNWGINQPNCNTNNPSPMFTSSFPDGNLWVTGHDTDFHCSAGAPNPGASCNYLKVAVTFVIRGTSTLPILALDHGTEVATAISNAFGSSAPTVDIVDPRSGFASLPLVDSQNKPLYSAIIVASDITCGGCDNNNSQGDTPDSNAINARALALLTYYVAGGGILALAGAENISVFYNFLPVSATGITTTSPYTITHAGLSFGLIEGSDDNCCITHNSFDLPGAGSDRSLTVLETDGAGQAETMVV